MIIFSIWQPMLGLWPQCKSTHQTGTRPEIENEKRSQLCYALRDYRRTELDQQVYAGICPSIVHICSTRFFDQNSDHQDFSETSQRMSIERNSN